MTDEDSLDDLSDIVGPELAGLVSTPVMQPVKTTVTSQATFTSDMPPDISDLRCRLHKHFKLVTYGRSKISRGLGPIL